MLLSVSSSTTTTFHFEYFSNIPNTIVQNLNGFNFKVTHIVVVAAIAIAIAIAMAIG